MAARETFSSKLGTLMVLVGSAVGLGSGSAEGDGVKSGVPFSANALFTALTIAIELYVA